MFEAQRPSTHAMQPDNVIEEKPTNETAGDEQEVQNNVEYYENEAQNLEIDLPKDQIIIQVDNEDK